ncbi:MAG: DUF1015 family protein [Bacteroidales bacterium OttesenSCG-928-I14]|jgi:uncharacterized protein (DUF1015 family)|nr:DUF1015 family protein [Bacteroidales bacterium OttesenSCG-928-I14]
MATIKPFKGIRPTKKYAKEISSYPYDILSSEEAREESKNNEKSFYHIIKPEIDFQKLENENNVDIYEKSAENFNKFQQKGWLLQDDKELYYIYAQTKNNYTQYGLVVCIHVNDYLNGIIKKHELTRKDKEEDRTKHISINNANTEPVFFAYPDNKHLSAIIECEIKKPPEYDFISSDGIGHHLWVIKNNETIRNITHLFKQIPCLYIADGHHRSAASVIVATEKAKNSTLHTGHEEYNYFMAVCFPISQLTIMNYNRVVNDLNGLTSTEFISALTENFYIKNKGREIYRPQKLHNFSLYLNKNWYSLNIKKNTYNDNDPISALDVTILSNLILNKILKIKDLRTDKRIDFVGGSRGLEELQRKVDNGEMAAAFALFPISMKQLINIADTGNIMPPKTTWFEPKLRSGLVIHKLD